MNRINQLIGEPVLTKPGDQIGTLISIDTELDQTIVSFAEDGRASFSMDSIWVLREPAKIKLDADNDYTMLPFWDYEDIMGIITMAESARLEYRKFAIQLSQKNPDAMEYTMHTLRQELELNRVHIISR